MVTHVHVTNGDIADKALELLFDPAAAAERFTDPYPLYEQIRTNAPVHRSATTGDWVVTRAADAEAVLRSPRWTSTPDFSQGWGGAQIEEIGPQVQLLSRALLFMDGEEHARLRRLVQSAFTPKAVTELRPRVETIVGELLDAMAEEHDAVDLIAEYAFPLPVIVIAEMLGVPPEDRDLFRTQIPKLTPLLEMGTPPEAFTAAGEAALTFAAYFQPLFEERRRSPRDDLMSALANAEIDGERIDPVDLLVTCILLLGAGHETTMNLIGNGVLALLRHPDQLAALRADDDPALPRSAVEELLRYDSPVQLTVRRSTEGATLDGIEVVPGEDVLVLLGAANRDPARFPDPERLDLRRGAQHVAFGYGAHHCLGSALARLEGEVAIPALVRRFPDLTLAAEPVHRRARTLRGVEALHVQLG